MSIPTLRAHCAGVPCALSFLRIRDLKLPHAVGLAVPIPHAGRHVLTCPMEYSPAVCQCPCVDPAGERRGCFPQAGCSRPMPGSCRERGAALDMPNLPSHVFLLEEHHAKTSWPCNPVAGVFCSESSRPQRGKTLNKRPLLSIALKRGLHFQCRMSPCSLRIGFTLSGAKPPAPAGVRDDLFQGGRKARKRHVP